MTQLIAFNSCLPFSGQVSGNKGSTMKEGWGGVRDVLEVGPPLASSVKHCVTLGQSGCLLPSISGHHGRLISGNISSEPGRFPYPFTITHWGGSLLRAVLQDSFRKSLPCGMGRRHQRLANGFSIVPCVTPPQEARVT